MIFSAFLSDDGITLGLEKLQHCTATCKPTPYIISLLYQQDSLWMQIWNIGIQDQFTILSACWKHVVTFAVLWSRFSANKWKLIYIKHSNNSRYLQWTAADNPQDLNFWQSTLSTSGQGSRHWTPKDAQAPIYPRHAVGSFISFFFPEEEFHRSALVLVDCQG